MRLKNLYNIFSLRKYRKLKQDFHFPLVALLAVSGFFKIKWHLKTKKGYSFFVDRGDLPIWDEYFASVNCQVIIDKELFLIIPKNDAVKKYHIQGAKNTFTKQSKHYYRNTKTPALVLELEQAEKSYFSQHGEDGVLEYLFNRIPIEHKFIVEFGAYDGINMSNSRYWIKEKGWSAYLIEAHERFFSGLQKLYQNNPRVTYEKAMVDEENINSLFKNAGVPKDFEILSIDIDSIDYYVWEALIDFTPKVVMIEYNSTILPGEEYIVPRDKVFELSATDKENASILSYCKLAASKNYHLIYGELSGANLFFVHESCLKYFEPLNITPEDVYQPPQFGLIAGGSAPNGRGY